MENNSRKLKDLLVILIVLFLTSISVYLVYTVDKLQDQISKRDTLLREQSDRENASKKEYNELINSLNQLFRDANLEDGGNFDVSKFIEHHNNLKDSISQLKTKLELIESHYGITAISKQRSVSDNRVVTTTSIKGSEKVDSALLLLPYFKDRIEKTGKNKWSINLTGKEYENIKKSYEDNMYRYNSLVDRYNNANKDYDKLVDRYNKLSDRYNDKVDFYRDILKEMAKKGLLKIDSSGIDMIYEY